MTIIDAHAHIVPPAIVAAVEGGRWHGVDFDLTPDGKLRGACGGAQAVLPWPDFSESLEKRIALMDSERVDVHVLSLSPSIFWYHSSPSDAVGYARAVNDSLAEVVAQAPDRFRAFAFLPLQDPEASVRELDRCMNIEGFVGGVVGTNVDGRDWDAPELLPVLREASEQRALLFIHPARIRGQDFLNRYHLRNLVGNPMETAVAFASLVFSGAFDKLSDLSVLLAHGGGFASLGIGRFDHGYRVRPEAQKHAAAPPSEYLQRVLLDTLTHDPDALVDMIRRFGPERFVLGTDYPADMGQRDPVTWLEGISGISPEQRAMILGGSLSRLPGMA
jgi:aminocarboxymuconate-semialdehyde decarboxylase